ncbi:uncharacterized protein EDB91DRAFT_1084941 [Suillus paluster]|uniref:uncharacterized protein n=1 Tax=Suillus paluster TaxID=48578 RepID=UPI001B87FA3F|nr:uncharacterized protein EDB91DRAFT_1084941 [Suillus paluster]KAG1731851.1 hypothetical protein EDB91DRAFT_1084941 [Suillus paluster]
MARNSTGTVHFMMQASIRPSVAGYVAKGIALCGKQQIWEATTAFDLVFTFTFANGDLKTSFLLLVIALFIANKHEEDNVSSVQGLAARPNADLLAARVMEAYLRVRLGTIAMDSALYSKAADHFTAAVKAGAFFATLDIHSTLFGWNLKSLWQIANQQRYYALVRSGQVGAALEAYRYMMDMSDETTKAIFLAWANSKSSVMLPVLQLSVPRSSPAFA